MAMVRARNGGTRFNLGEMTLTRCAVTLENGVVGIAYVQAARCVAEQAPWPTRCCSCLNGMRPCNGS